MKRWLLSLLLLSACASGPEGASQRLPNPPATPWTDAAAHPGPPKHIEACLRNRTNTAIDVSLSNPGEAWHPRQRYRLAPGSRLELAPDLPLAAAFTSVPDGKLVGDAAEIRSRIYLLNPTPPASECAWHFRSDSLGRVDLFAHSPEGVLP